MVQGLIPGDFQVKQNIIDAQLERIAVEPTERILSPENAVNQPFDQYFSCQFCLNVVDDPQECRECNQLNCKSCLETWLGRNSTCPNCRKEW